MLLLERELKMKARLGIKWTDSPRFKDHWKFPPHNSRGVELSRTKGDLRLDVSDKLQPRMGIQLSGLFLIFLQSDGNVKLIN